MSRKKLIKIIEVWDHESKFISQLQDFINKEDIEILDIKYSAMASDNYDQTGFSSMIIYVEKQVEKENDNE